MTPHAELSACLRAHRGAFTLEVGAAFRRNVARWLRSGPFACAAPPAGHGLLPNREPVERGAGGEGGANPPGALTHARPRVAVVVAVLDRALDDHRG